MYKALRNLILIQLFIGFYALAGFSAVLNCSEVLALTKSQVAQQQTEKNVFFSWLSSSFKNIHARAALGLKAYINGLPSFINRSEELRRSGRYLKYKDLAEMGLAETGISVRYSQKQFAGLNTPRGQIILSTHALAIADGWATLYLSGRSRPNSRSFILLARWIEKVMPHGILGDVHNWGTAIPVDINKLPDSDPKKAEIEYFNAKATRDAARELRKGGALVVFPAGHVSSIHEGGKFPDNVYDDPGSWMDSVLRLAQLGNADIVLAHVDSVNSESFYRKRKRFGGGDSERIVWFLSEALAKKGQAIDIFLSNPMSLEELYHALIFRFEDLKEKDISGSKLTVEQLKANPKLAIELVRRYTYKLSQFHPQDLDTTELPQKIDEL